MMTPDHPRWEEFCARLEGPEGCNFVTLETDDERAALREVGAAVYGNLAWWCDGMIPNRYRPRLKRENEWLLRQNADLRLRVKQLEKALRKTGPATVDAIRQAAINNARRIPA